jgi:tetratricopeptide (TPR) repeat protein
VAHVLALAKDFPQAQAVQRLAAEMAPETISYRLVLSDLFAREGRLPEALHEARLAVDQWPDHAQALGHLAHIRQMMGELDEAEETLRLAIQLAPHNDHLRREHARLRDRRDTQSARPTMTIM